MNDEVAISEIDKPSRVAGNGIDPWLEELLSASFEPERFRAQEQPFVSPDALVSDRAEILNSLSTEQKARLSEIQMRAALNPKCESSRELIDQISPALAQKNKEFDQQITQRSSATNDGRSGLSFDTEALFSNNQSTIQCHRAHPQLSFAPLGLSHSDFPLESADPECRLLRRENETLYNPYGKSSEVAQKFGVHFAFRENAGLQEPYFYYNSGGKKIELNVRPGVDSERDLRALEVRLLSELQRDYGVRISGRGDSVAKQYSSGAFMSGSRLLTAVRPKLYELEAIADACKRSRSTLEAGTVRVVFMGEPIQRDKLNAGEYWHSLNKEPTIVMYRSTDSESLDREPIRLTMLHELGHRQQDTSDWYTDNSVPEAMGWRKAGDRWIIAGENGQFFKNPEDYGADWVRCDASGAPLDKNGKQVSDLKNAHHLRSCQVHDEALVTPPTYYFTNPTEEMAEAIMLFRSGSLGRMQLMSKSPIVYEYARRRDLQDINRTASRAEPQLRLPSGEVVTSTPEVIAQIDEFESNSIVLAKIDSTAMNKAVAAARFASHSFDAPYHKGSSGQKALSPETMKILAEGAKRLDSLTPEPEKVVQRIMETRAVAEKWGADVHSQSTALSYPEHRARAHAHYAAGLLANGDTKKALTAIKQAESAPVSQLNFGYSLMSDSNLALFKNLRGVKVLDLSYTPVTGAAMDTIVGFKELEILNLRNMQGTAEQFAKVGQLKSLTELSLSEIEMPINDAFAGIGPLPKLEQLRLSQIANVDNGTMKLVGEQFRNLTCLSVIGAEITDECLAPLKGLSHLKQLDLIWCNKITGDGVKHLASCPSLELLSMTVKEGADLRALSRTKLKSIRLSGPISDANAASIGAISTLEQVYFGETTISDAAFESIAGIASLKDISMPSNCNGSMLKAISRAKGLSHIYIPSSSHVTEGAVKELSVALPKCSID